LRLQIGNGWRKLHEEDQEKAGEIVKKISKELIIESVLLAISMDLDLDIL
jgi:hypothetical protein